MAHHERGRFAIKRVVGVRVPEELREEYFEDVDHIWGPLNQHQRHRRRADLPNMGDHVWLMTSRQTDPESSSMFGWNILFMKPIDGDL